jgi:hypothetical protein
MADPCTIATGDPRFEPDGPLLVNGYLFTPAEDRTPEHQLVEFCRMLRREYPEISLISFRVEREDGDWQTASFGRCAVEEEE